MNEEILDRLVPYIAQAAVPTDSMGEEGPYYEELQRLGEAFYATCQAPKTGEVVSQIIEIIRDLAWRSMRQQGRRSTLDG